MRFGGEVLRERARMCGNAKKCVRMRENYPGHRLYVRLPLHRKERNAKSVWTG